jgi:hypothetical protein
MLSAQKQDVLLWAATSNLLMCMGVGQVDASDLCCMQSQLLNHDTDVYDHCPQDA